MIREIFEAYPKLTSKIYKVIDKTVLSYVNYKYSHLSTTEKEEIKDFSVDKVLDKLSELQDDSTSELYNKTLEELDPKKLLVYVWNITKLSAGNYYSQNIKRSKIVAPKSIPESNFEKILTQLSESDQKTLKKFYSLSNGSYVLNSTEENETYKISDILKKTSYKRKSIDASSRSISGDSDDENEGISNVASEFSTDKYITKDEQTEKIQNFLKAIGLSSGDRILFSLMSELESTTKVADIINKDPELKKETFPKAEVTPQSVNYRYSNILKTIKQPDNQKLFFNEYND